MNVLPPALLEVLAHLGLVCSRLAAGSRPGSRRARTHGTGIEFDDYKEYQPGDSLRHVDGRAYARLDRLYVKLFQAEEQLPVAVYVDTSQSMGVGRPAKIDCAIRIAAGIGFMALSAGDRLAVVSFNSEEIRVWPPLAGRDAYPRLRDWLLGLRTGGGTNFGELARQEVPGVHGGLSVVVSDLFAEEAVRAVSSLASRGSEVVVIHVLAPEDLAPPFLAGECRLTDSESGARLELVVDDDLLEEYRTNFDAWRRSLERSFGASGIRLIEVPSDASAEEIFLVRLRREGFVR